MHFELSDEQRLIRETARKFSEKELAPHAGEIDGKEAFPRQAWERLSELGFAGITIPEDFGGLGMDYITVTAANRQKLPCYRRDLLCSPHHPVFDFLFRFLRTKKAISACYG